MDEFYRRIEAERADTRFNPGTEAQLNKEMTAGYIGFDPTSDSLHVGNLLQIILMRLQRAGHKPYALVGGATGMVGDPSGKSLERNLLDAASIEKNCKWIKKQLENCLKITVFWISSGMQGSILP